MKTNWLLRGHFALAALLVMTSSLFGQATSGNVVGTIFDSSGAGIPNATVEAKNEVTNVKADTKTNSKGEYRLSNLLTGKYDVTATASGFNALTSGGISVRLNATETVNLTLPVGQ